jgi:hypothetical protein
VNYYIKHDTADQLQTLNKYYGNSFKIHDRLFLIKNNKGFSNVYITNREYPILTFQEFQALAGLEDDVRQEWTLDSAYKYLRKLREGHWLNKKVYNKCHETEGFLCDIQLKQYKNIAYVSCNEVNISYLYFNEGYTEKVFPNKKSPLLCVICKDEEQVNLVTNHGDYYEINKSSNIPQGTHDCILIDFCKWAAFNGVATPPKKDNTKLYTVCGEFLDIVFRKDNLSIGCQTFSKEEWVVISDFINKGDIYSQRPVVNNSQLVLQKLPSGDLISCKRWTFKRADLIDLVKQYEEFLSIL